MVQGIRFITEISNVLITKKYDGSTIKDEVLLGDLDYPLDNPSTYSVFGAWQRTDTSQIIKDTDVIKDGTVLKAINTAPVGVAEINAFTDNPTDQIHKYTTTNAAAPRRLQNTPITKYTKLSWIDLGSNVKQPNGYPMKGISASSNGDNLIDKTQTHVGDYLTNLSTAEGSTVASLPLYDIFVSDIKGMTGNMHFVLDMTGGKYPDGSSGQKTTYEGMQYGETLRSYLTRVGFLGYTTTSKLTPPSSDQYFQGWLAWANNPDASNDAVSDEHVDLSSKLYPPLGTFFNGQWWEVHLYPQWGTYEKDDTGANKTTSNATLTNSDGDVIGKYTDLPAGTTAQDLIDGKYEGTDANGNTIPVGTNQTAKLGDVQKPLSEVANDDKIKSVQWNDADLIVQDNTKGDITYTKLATMEYSKLNISWSQLMNGDASSFVSPTSKADKDKLPSVKIGDKKLSINDKGEMTYDSITIWKDNTWGDDATADNVTWSKNDHKLSFAQSSAASDITNMGGFSNFGTANIEPNSTGTTLNNGSVSSPSTDALQPGDNNIDTSGADTNTRPVTSENPAAVTVPDGIDASTGLSKTKDMLMDAEDIGIPLADLVKYDVPNYTIGNGYIVTTADGTQTIIDPSDPNWIDKIGGIDKLPGSTIEPFVQYPAGRNQYIGDANGGVYPNGTTSTSVWSNQSSMNLGVLNVMMPVALNDTMFSTGYNDSPDHDTLASVWIPIPSGSTVYAYYQAIEGTFKKHPREFYLVDRSTITSFPSDLVSYDMNDYKSEKTGIMATEPDNLGFTNTNQVVSALTPWTNVTAARTDNVDIKQITFKLYMHGYDSYNRLGEWLRGRELALYYLNEAGYQNFINVNIAELTKTELSTDAAGYLVSTLTLNALSTWYDIQSIQTGGVFNNEHNGLSGKAYVEFSVSNLSNESGSLTLSLQKLSSDGTTWTETAKEVISKWSNKNTLDYSSVPTKMYVLADGNDISSALDFINSTPLVISEPGTWRVQVGNYNVNGLTHRERLIN